MNGQKWRFPSFFYFLNLKYLCPVLMDEFVKNTGTNLILDLFYETRPIIFS
jgi:hypothetical protein